ncbi:uncharacterized protein LOC127802032 [Diospyros lotus]|uniref:uncharacterized protein LOC127802032 n=1 Tax=Diospyros lotus TaxID=55363 RepID=UPI002250D5D6|nr:uncharacterized protein LOC127802032 [Diospyros lotus]XP_052193624.1 uncharacterized protein LOC127802032 [Diospyros lotus]XP_052193625.1 uncharacterized protein LOC127802032 [Diospyros lotus]XP_052193626.1 uncharacterized protein LOC127802032 [Diospyros lotus]XP_052193628.1 uncharacterized protein LOC127802032 [Diospyros lotus]XP_052193629.1 uncharacterized protein LOC127802032 [Diospyros lotus]
MCSTAPRYPICAKYPTLYPPECPKCSALSSSSGCQEYYYNLVEAVNNYTGSPVDEYSFGAGLRKFWEEWDLRILILYILYTQLYLLIFGRFRRRSKRKFLINLNVSLLYIFADLLAAIALGKLSKVKDEGTLNKEAVFPKFKPDEMCNPDKPESLLRGLWAPVILFYLGGPDTITLLYIEETQLWLKHLISLLTQGGRACFVLIETWTPSGLSVLSLFMWISGMIKYAERTWVIKSRARAISEGCLQPDDCTVMDFVGISPSSPNRKLELEKKTQLVVEGYICFRTLKPHIPGYHGLKRPLAKFIKEDTDPKDIFKQIEIELGFMYDVLFSKVGTIFTAWGFILRFITLSCVVCVLVGFFMVDKSSTKDLKDDVQTTIILLLGAIFLEIVGLLLQLVSDWAVVWAWKHQSKLSSPILFLHEHLISHSRWSKEVGQFSLLNFCIKYEAKVFDGMVRAVCGWRKLLSINFSLPSRKANKAIKVLIINQLRERSQNNSGQPSQISSMKTGEWTLTKYRLKEAPNWPKWTMNIEFGEAIVLWHLATDICYHDEEPTNDSEAAKRLSNYMMHLLLICPNSLPFCNTDGDFLTACADIMEILKNKKLALADVWEQCKSPTVKRAKDLASALMQKPNEERWEIMSSMWVEMLCHAAKECKLKNHAQELRHGGEFLTHVWLLLMHFGIYGDQERIVPPDLRPNAQEGIKGFNDFTQSTFFEGCELSSF